VIYLDNNATTRPAPEVVQAMLRVLQEDYANPSSVHRPGQQARKLIDDARAQVASLIGCSPGELTFTSGGTESINAALAGLYRMRQPRTRVLISRVEHSATMGACEQLKLSGADITEIEVGNDGLLDMDHLKRELTGDVALVSMLWANNETGVIFDIPAVAALCKASRVPFHCDGTQAVGKIPVNVRAAGVDAMSFAGHKFHGPKGVGGLYICRGQRFSTLIAGGPQETGRRGGTENVPGIVGMGVAADLAAQALKKSAQIASLRDELEKQILQTIPTAHVNGSPEHRLPNTTNIGFEQLESEAILLLLSERGICASAGAACSSGSLEASHVLRAMRLDPRIAHGAIRFSLSRYTTRDEIRQALTILPEVINKLRTVLPVGQFDDLRSATCDERHRSGQWQTRRPDRPRPGRPRRRTPR